MNCTHGSSLILPKKHLHRPNVRSFCCGIPKCELHVHIEGTLEPPLMFKLAKRNQIPLNFRSVDEVRSAYNFHNLQSFLDIYYVGCRVLVHERDFYELTMEYLTRVAKQNVRHVEMFFDPQSHTSRGVAFGTFMSGFHRACVDAEKKFGITSSLVMCFLRHMTADEAMETLEQSLPYKHLIVAVGLDSSEVGHPPVKFQKVFEAAIKYGYLTVAHAGEEGPASYIWQALDCLQVKRVDHGVRAADDQMLMRYLAEHRTPLTMCPFSGNRLRVVKSLEVFPLKYFLNKDLCVSVHSDDPAYFGGYINANYIGIRKALGLTRKDITQIAKNSVEATFCTPERKSLIMSDIDNYVEAATA
jgi:adenosine deaminase